MSTACLPPELLWSLDDIEWTLFFLGDEPPDVAEQVALPVACEAPEAGEAMRGAWAPRPDLAGATPAWGDGEILAAYYDA